MAVPKEHIRGDELAKTRGLPPVVCLVRAEAGGWTFNFLVEGEAVLPDGRRVVISRHVNLRATDYYGHRPGRKPSAA